jgi:hypothetical protein
MKHHDKKITPLVPAVLLLAVLASCGGGGGGSATVAPPYQDIVTTLPDPLTSYTTPSDREVLTQISAMREGAGYLIPNTNLDTAASSHAAYLVDNNFLLSPVDYLTTSYGGILGGHYENDVTMLPGYTGKSPQARATAAGYTGTVTEYMTFGATDGANCVDLLGNSVYHLIELISPFIDLGISFNVGNGAGSACAIVLGVGSNTPGQLPAVGPVVYPYDGQSGVLPKFYNHAEVPVAANDLPFAGHPVAVSLYTLDSSALSGGNIVINEFSIEQCDVACPNVANPLPTVRVLAKTGVTSTGPTGPALTVDDVIPRAGFVVLLPEAPLVVSKTYAVTFNATVKGQPVSKTWSFTTNTVTN